MIVFASILLLVSFVLGFTAGEIMVNPNARVEDKAELERAANLAFSLFVAVQVMLACLMVMSGVLKTRLHVALRAVGFLFAGVLVSWLLVYLNIATGLLPRSLGSIASVMSAWIRRMI